MNYCTNCMCCDKQDHSYGSNAADYEEWTCGYADVGRHPVSGFFGGSPKCIDIRIYGVPCEHYEKEEK